MLRLLADAGLAEARAGRDGGYRLTRPPGEVALLGVGGRGRVRPGALHPARRALPLGAGLRGPCRLVGGGAGLPGLAAPHHLADLVAADAQLETGRGISAEGVPPP